MQFLKQNLIQAITKNRAPPILILHKQYNKKNNNINMLYKYIKNNINDFHLRITNSTFGPVHSKRVFVISPNDEKKHA